MNAARCPQPKKEWYTHMQVEEFNFQKCCLSAIFKNIILILWLKLQKISKKKCENVLGSKYEIYQFFPYLYFHQRLFKDHLYFHRVYLYLYLNQKTMLVFFSLPPNSDCIPFLSELRFLFYSLMKRPFFLFLFLIFSRVTQNIKSI